MPVAQVDRAAVIPGGVNSSIRAFKAVGGEPYVVASASGATITDVEGTTYIDLVQSYGAVIAGHMDGRLRIYARDDGRVLWETNTLREYETESGDTGRGGSFGGGGPMVADGMPYANSGSGIYFHMPGNVMLVFGVADDTEQ